MDDITEEPYINNLDNNWRGPKALASLRHKDYALYSIGQLISFSGTWMQTVAQGWLILKLTNSEFYLGLVAAIGTLPILLFSLPAGVLADRYEKRKIVIITQILAMLQAFILTYLTITGKVQPWHVLVLAGFMGCINVIDIPARHSMVIELVGKEDLTNAIALNSAIFNSTRIIGPAIAGIILAWKGTGICFLINAISYVAALIALIFIKKLSVSLKKSDVSIYTQTKEGLKYIKNNHTVRDLLILTGVISIFGSQYSTILPAFARDVLKVGAREFGILTASAGFGALMGAMAVAALESRFKREAIMITGALIIPLGLMCLSLWRSYHISLIFLAFVGFGMMLFLSISTSIIQLSSPDELRGRVMGVRTLVFLGLSPFSAMQIGAMAEYIGTWQSMLIGGIICLVIVVYYVFLSKRMWKIE